MIILNLDLDFRPSKRHPVFVLYPKRFYDFDSSSSICCSSSLYNFSHPIFLRCEFHLFGMGMSSCHTYRHKMCWYFLSLLYSFVTVKQVDRLNAFSVQSVKLWWCESFAMNDLFAVYVDVIMMRRAVEDMKGQSNFIYGQQILVINDVFAERAHIRFRSGRARCVSGGRAKMDCNDGFDWSIGRTTSFRNWFLSF